MNDFDDIRPYNDEEMKVALRHITSSLIFPELVEKEFPGHTQQEVVALLESIQTVDELQRKVMYPIVKGIVDNTTAGVSVSGLENVTQPCVFFSNHRDIVMDPAILDMILVDAGLQCPEICAGNNLLSDEIVYDIMRSNRMIIVHRDLNPKEQYLSSLHLSDYIRDDIKHGKSVWIAQRSGRAKNGIDVTSQGLIKMLMASGNGDFVDDLAELNIVPMSISYEYETCAALKARELILSAAGPYIKAPREDFYSIVSGINQDKGHVHIHFGKPISREELSGIASQKLKNARFDDLRILLDRRIQEGYHLWPTNYIGSDLLNDEQRYLDMYTADDVEKFYSMLDVRVDSLQYTRKERLMRDALRIKMLEIYANPVASKLALAR